MSPLNWAAYRNELELVQYLLSKGANPNTVSVWGTTPLHYAVMNNSIAMVKALLDAGAPLDVPLAILSPDFFKPSCSRRSLVSQPAQFISGCSSKE